MLELDGVSTMKNIFGIVKVGEKGQIVIPKEARDLYDIKPGDSLLVIGGKVKGIAIVKTDVIKDVALAILNDLSRLEES